MLINCALRAQRRTQYTEGEVFLAVPASAAQALMDEVFNSTVEVPSYRLHEIRAELEHLSRQNAIDASDYHYIATEICARLGMPVEELRHATLSVSMERTSGRLNNLAIALIHNGRGGEAVDLLEEALSLEGPALYLLANLCEALMCAGEREAARDALVVAQSIADLGRPDHLVRLAHAAATVKMDVLAVRLLAGCLARIAGDGEPSDALAYIDDCADLRRTPALGQSIERVRARRDIPRLRFAGVDAEVAEIVARGDHSAAIAQIYDAFEKCEHDGNGHVDALMDALDPKRLGAEEVVAVLIATLHLKDDLEHRGAFIGRARPVLQAEQEGEAAILDGLV